MWLWDLTDIFLKLAGGRGHYMIDDMKEVITPN